MIPLPWRWLGAALTVVLSIAGIYMLGRSHASAAWEQRWTARESALREAAREAQRNADDVLARQIAATREAERRYADAKSTIDRVSADNRALAGRLQELAARRRSVPEPTEYAGCLRELVAERSRAERGAELLAAGGALLARVSAERAAGVAAAVSVCDAWPR